MQAFAERDVHAYYRAALLALRHLDARRPSGRRFGAEADALWGGFKGDLGTAERIDLLLRDADAEWRAAFGARTVFARDAVAEDDAFGAGWPSLDSVDAEELWRSLLRQPAPSDLIAALEAAAQAWDLKLSPFDPGPVGAAERLVVAGPSAIAATVRAFAGRSDLDLADQVLVIATPPAHRQLAALGGALLTHAGLQIVTAAEAREEERPRRVLLSDDAAPEDRAEAEPRR